ncbi:MAG: hypothetical protein J5537_01830 [Lachnospiraceae bacterium]|nr:hypothetical protein [Lachnospiraceae bacterium]
MRKRIFLCSVMLALLAAGCAQTSDVKESENKQGIFEEVDNALKTEGVTKGETPETPEVTETSTGPLWTRGGEDFTMDATLSQYGSGTTLTITSETTEDGNDLSTMTVFKDGKEVAKNRLVFIVNRDDKFVSFGFDQIDEIGFADCTMDGNDDIIVIGQTERGKEVAICEWEKRYSEEYNDSFYSNDMLSDSMEKVLGNDLSVATVTKAICGDSYTGSFASYKEAYTAAANLAKLKYGEDVKFSLMYFNDDDIPDLLMSVPSLISLYMYDNAGIHCPIYEWPFGAGGNAGYDLLTKHAAVANFDHDYAGLIGYETYMIMNEKYEMKTAYYSECFNFDDLNDNGVPDPEETTDEALNNAQGKIKYVDCTGANLSEAEVEQKMNELAKLGTECIEEDLSYDDLLAKLK